MSTSFYKEKLPEYLEKVKSMVDKNLEIVVKEVECAITEDKYHNVLKGRRTAAENAIWGCKKVDKLIKENEKLDEEEQSSYYKEMLPVIIQHLEIMYQLDLKVIDIDLDLFDGDFELLSSAKDSITKFFGKDMTAALLRNANKGSALTEDKLHNVVKSRQIAVEDTEWVMVKIGELASESSQEEKEEENTTNWAKKMAGK